MCFFYFVFFVKEINFYKKSNSKFIKLMLKVFKICVILFIRDYFYFFCEYVVFFVKLICCNFCFGGYVLQLVEKDRVEKFVLLCMCIYCYVIGKVVYMS